MAIGSWTELAGASGTIAAVVVALGIAIADARRRDAERKDEQAGQARLITVETKEDAIGGVLYVLITNHSAAPVFSVAVEAVHVTPDPLRVRIKSERRWRRLDAGEKVKAACLLFELDGITVASVEPPSIVSADVSFVDSVGLRWRRWGNTPPRRGAPVRRVDPPSTVPEVEAPDHE